MVLVSFSSIHYTLRPVKNKWTLLITLFSLQLIPVQYVNAVFTNSHLQQEERCIVFFFFKPMTCFLSCTGFHPVYLLLKIEK